MQRVLDLSGDVFAMPPLGHLSDPLPAVGDVIANTRTPDDPTVEYLTEGTPEWADPPFLRVVEVEPILHADDDYPDASHFSLGEDECWFWEWDDSVSDFICHEDADLPGAVPGGWAIRVEPYDDWCHPESACDPSTCTRIQRPDTPPTGRPLNEEEA